MSQACWCSFEFDRTDAQEAVAVERDPMLAALLDAADAVRLGRAGDVSGAHRALDRARRATAHDPLLLAVLGRVVISAMAADGWGDPVEWLTGALSTAGLTPRQREVLTLVAEGLPNRQIADRLYISYRTVEKHVEQLLAKTGAANRAQLVSYAWRRAA